MKYCLIVLAFAIACFSACTGNRLDQTEANSQLESYFEKHPEESIGNIAFEAVIKGKDSGNNNIVFRLYINAGLLKRKETLPNVNADSIYIYEITDAGKPYLIKTQLSKNGYPLFVVKTFDYYVDKITGIKYSPDKKEAAAYFIQSIKDPTPFGKGAIDPGHKRYLIGFFRFDHNNWKFQRIEVDINEYWKLN